MLAAFVAFFAAATAQTFNDGAPSGDYESYGALRWKPLVTPPPPRYSLQHAEMNFISPAEHAVYTFSPSHSLRTRVAAGVVSAARVLAHPGRALISNGVRGYPFVLTRCASAC